MNILVIGNGFDIEHGLPTKYSQFLEFSKYIISTTSSLKQTEYQKNLVNLLNDNIWFKYFWVISTDTNGNILDCNKTWIDFETEIADILINLDNNSPDILNYPEAKIEDFYLKFNKKISPEKLKLFLKQFGVCLPQNRFKFSNKGIINRTSFINYLYLQLQNFIYAFELYCLFVNELQIDLLLPRKTESDIKTVSNSFTNDIRFIISYFKEHNIKIFNIDSKNCNISEQNLINNKFSIYYTKLSEKLLINSLSINCILSFNYTDTYERLYENGNFKYCYIHGKAQDDPLKTNIIIGIDANLNEYTDNHDFSYEIFKKYFQRIINKTGSEYKDWFKTKSKSDDGTNKVYIVGHSLDKSDYDVLYEIFSSKNFKILVYYHSQDDFVDKVKKVIKILDLKESKGKQELIHRVHGENWTIKFIYQYDENEGLFIDPDKRKLQDIED
jgi:hypothetical protein